MDAAHDLEALAREICQNGGGDPDEIVAAGDPLGNPIDVECWQLFLPDAEASLRALSQGVNDD